MATVMPRTRTNNQDDLTALFPNKTNDDGTKTRIMLFGFMVVRTTITRPMMTAIKEEGFRKHAAERTMTRAVSTIVTDSAVRELEK